MKWLDKMLGKSEPASDNQIEFIRKLAAEKPEDQTAPVFAKFGMIGKLDDDETLHALGRDKASNLIDGLLDLDGITEGQRNYLIMMFRELDDMVTVANKPSEATKDAYWKMHGLLRPYFSEADLDSGPYDMNWSVLSKRQASAIITDIKPSYEAAKETW